MKYILIAFFLDSHSKLQQIFTSAKQIRSDNKNVYIRNRKTTINETLEDIIKSDLKQIHSENSMKSLRLSGTNIQLHTTIAAAAAANIITAAPATPLRSKPPVDPYHQIFCDRLLVENYETMANDFKAIKRMIDIMDKAQVEYLKTKSIAPFNSNLPVLNISKVTPPPALPIKPNTKIDTTTASSRHSKTSETCETPTTGKGSNMSGGEKSRSAVGKKTTKRKRKRGGTRVSRAKLSPNKMSIAIIECNHPQPDADETKPERILINFNDKSSYAPCNEFERSIICNLDALLDISDEDFAYHNSFVVDNKAINAIELVTNNSNVITSKSSCSLYKEVTSLDIFRNNFENLRKKNMEFNSNTKMRQKRQNQEQYELSVLYLRRKLDRRDSDCEIMVNMEGEHILIFLVAYIKLKQNFYQDLKLSQLCRSHRG